MSKYEEYRTIVEKMETTFEAGIENIDRKVRIDFNPVSDNLAIEIPDPYYEKSNFKIACETGKALYLALKQIYE
jgi:hypothetical protein